MVCELLPEYTAERVIVCKAVKPHTQKQFSIYACMMHAYNSEYIDIWIGTRHGKI